MSDDDLMPVTRGMLRRWAETLGRSRHVELTPIRTLTVEIDGRQLTAVEGAIRALLDQDDLDRGADEDYACDPCSESGAAWTCARTVARDESVWCDGPDTSPDPEGAEAAVLAPESETAREHRVVDPTDNVGEK